MTFITMILLLLESSSSAQKKGGNMRSIRGNASKDGGHVVTIMILIRLALVKAPSIWPLMPFDALTKAATCHELDVGIWAFGAIDYRALKFGGSALEFWLERSRLRAWGFGDFEHILARSLSGFHKERTDCHDAHMKMEKARHYSYMALTHVLGLGLGAVLSHSLLGWPVLYSYLQSAL